MSQLINMLCAKCLLHWQCRCSLALAGSTAACKMFCSAAWRSSSLDLWAGRTHQEDRQVPNVRSLEGKGRITFNYDNKCLPLPSAGDNMDYLAVCCRWKLRVCAFQEGGFCYSLAIPYPCKKCGTYTLCAIKLCSWSNWLVHFSPSGLVSSL